MASHLLEKLLHITHFADHQHAGLKRMPKDQQLVAGMNIDLFTRLGGNHDLPAFP